MPETRERRLFRVVLTDRRPEHLKKSLETILAQDQAFDRLLVVDIEALGSGGSMVREMQSDARVQRISSAAGDR